MSKVTVTPVTPLNQGRLSPPQYIIAAIVSGWVNKDLDAFACMDRPLEPRHFLSPYLKDAWTIILEVRDEGLVPDTSVMYMKMAPLIRKHRDNEEAVSFLNYIQMCQIEIFTQNINYMVRKVSESFYNAELNRIEAETGMIQDVHERVKVRTERLDLASKDSVLAKKRHKLAPELASDLIDDISKDKSSVLVSLGYTGINERVTFGRKHLMILAGRAGMGKTTMAMNMVRKQLWEGMRVGFLSLEMSDMEVSGALASQNAMCEVQRVRDGVSDDEMNRIYKSLEDMTGYKLAVEDTPAMSLENIEESIVAMSRDLKGLDVLYIDHIHIMHEATNGKLREGITKISAGLKMLAKKYDMGIIALCQMNREADKREVKEPQVSDLRESGSLEQDADVIGFMFRESYYLKAGEESDGDDISKLVIKKNRHRRVNNFSIEFRMDGNSQKLIEC